MHGFEVTTRMRGAAVVPFLVSLVVGGSAWTAVGCMPNVAVDASSATSIRQLAIDVTSAGDSVLVGGIL